jgi:hypothetical protein
MGGSRGYFRKNRKKDEYRHLLQANDDVEAVIAGELSSHCDVALVRRDVQGRSIVRCQVFEGVWMGLR